MAFTSEEVLQEFTSYDGGHQEWECDERSGKDVHHPNLIYLPPWEHKGVNYGPTLGAYGQLMRDWEQSIHAGGLWDYGEEAKLGATKENASPIRHDALEMGRMVANQSTRVSHGQLAIYKLFWLEGMSLRECATALGITPGAVRDGIKKLRRRLKKATA